MRFQHISDPKDLPLAEDAEFLIQALIHILEQSTTPQVSEIIKQLPECLDSTQLIADALPHLNDRQTQNLILACGLFAQVLNIAEDVHHQRRRDYRAEASDVPEEGSFAAFMEKLHAAAIPAAELQNELNKTTIAAVLTALLFFFFC